MKEIFLKNKKFNEDKLLKFGFKLKGEQLFYCQKILDDEFNFQAIFQNGKMQTKIIENESEEEYTLHLVQNAEGAFVGRVREEHDKIVNKIIETCAERKIFFSVQSTNLVEYIKNKYQSELEFLWDSFPVGAIWRRRDNKKWYGVMMNVPINRIGLNGDEMVDIVNVRADAEKFIDDKFVFPAYHMNKKSWVSILLNKGIEDEKLFDLVDKSFLLALGRKR